jgi:AraC family transcriptional regulator
VSERRAQPLFEGTVVRLYDVSCHARASAPQDEEHTLTTQVVLPLRGCFEVHRGREWTVADPASMVVFRAGADYRVGHPAHGGDDCFVFALPPRTAQDIIGPADDAGIVDPPVLLRAHRLRAALRRGTAVDPLESEEHALDLLRGIVRNLPARTSSGGPAGRAQRVTVDRVRALLASRPAERWRLDQISREVFVSPSHLARQFRSVTGGSIAGYLLRLRLGLALDRLADGEKDLAALAVELGFAHHSHFSARFRATFGIAPSTCRSSLTAGRLAQLRTIVTAPGRAAS